MKKYILGHLSLKTKEGRKYGLMRGKYFRIQGKVDKCEVRVTALALAT